MSKRKHAIDSYFQRAVQAHASGRSQEAESMYRELLAVAPTHADSLHMLGVLALQANQPAIALRFFDQAIALRARAAYHVNRAIALHRLGQSDEAADACAAALRLERACAEAQQVLGDLRSDQGDMQAAIAAYREAARMKPALPGIHNNLAIALRHTGRLEEAEQSLREALRREPGESGATANLSSVLKELGRVTEAETLLRNVLRTHADDPALSYNLGLLLLLKGEFQEGWQRYEARSLTPAVSFPQFHRPRWTGEEVAGRTLLVHAEQGLGTIIQFCRYVPLLAQRVARDGKVVFQVPRSLKRLLASLVEAPPTFANDENLPPFDLVCPLLSLPGLFDTRVETVPNAVPYLAAEPARVAAWRNRLEGRGLRVGIAWQGNPTSQAELGRSIPLADFLSLGQVSGVHLISLQKHDGLDQLSRLPPGAPIEVLGDDFDSGPDAFLDAAAVMMSLDLVITSDTSIAHLAGALGRPVWVVLQHVPDWRWMLQRPDSPWYPSMTLYRQTERGNWSDLFAHVAADLAARVARAQAPTQP